MKHPIINQLAGKHVKHICVSNKPENQSRMPPLSREWVLDTVREIAHSGRNEAARVRALELLGIEEHMFIKRTEQTNIKLDIARMSAAQIRELAQAVEARIAELTATHVKQIEVGPTIELEAIPED
jgi:hypothetical protein